MQIINKSEARLRGLKYFFTGEPCKVGHIAKRHTQTGSCFECRRAATRKFRIDKPERWRELNRLAKQGKTYKLSDAAKERKRARAVANKDAINARRRALYAESGERRRSVNKQWRDSNLPKAKLIEKRWRNANPGLRAANRRRRQAAKLQACPPWADLAAIKSIYVKAADLTRQTGVAHHVDHMYPLQGKTCCGLHIAENLRIITAVENIHKANRLPDAC